MTARAGYSGTPLARKLGIKEHARVGLVGAPNDFEEVLDGLPDTARVTRRPTKDMDVVIAFYTSAAQLDARFDGLAQRVATDGSLWIAWPKKASGVATDLREGVVQEIGLAKGLVDVKVCAIDETWSGLKFVRRLEDR